MYRKAYSTAEYTEHFATFEYFIDTPDGRMSVRMPHSPMNPESVRRLDVIISALNAANKDGRP